MKEKKKFNLGLNSRNITYNIEIGRIYLIQESIYQLENRKH